MQKYSEKFLNNTNILKTSTIGIEFEFYTKDISYYKTLELLNQELSPVKVWGFKQYHSDFKPDEKNFKLEPDLSGGNNMCEIITGPLKYYEAKYYLVKILKFIQKYGYTNEKSSIHYNISFDSDVKDLNDLNILKMILSLDEDEIYSMYPSRKDNVYAKTIKKIVPYKDYDFHNVSIDTVKNNLRLPNDKYYGVNFLHVNSDKDEQRLEFRYIGGKDYENNVGQILFFLDKFIISTWECIDEPFNNNDILKLEEYLSSNISNFKNFSVYDMFITEFPTISIQIDQVNLYDIVNAYYDNIYLELFNLIESVEGLKDCILNYVTVTQTIEVVDANIKTTQNLKGYDFINCDIVSGIFDDCKFDNCEINDAQLVKCIITNSEINDSKVLNCKVEGGVLNSCFFMEGYLNSAMEGGVFRSGKIGPYGYLSSDTKIVTDYNNFFNTKFGEDKMYSDKFDIKGGK